MGKYEVESRVYKDDSRGLSREDFGRLKRIMEKPFTLTDDERAFFEGVDQWKRDSQNTKYRFDRVA